MASITVVSETRKRGGEGGHGRGRNQPKKKGHLFCRRRKCLLGW
uniref:Uncharacterized protein n=1 Tax=Arundo donax TaxID=35708 RepID=A0A0A8Y951_ARUDO